MHVRQNGDAQLVEGALRRVREAGPALRDCADLVVVREPEVGPLLVEIGLHLPDDLAAFGRGSCGLLLRVHLVVFLVAEAGVAPAAPLGTCRDREHEVGVDQRRPVPHGEVEALVRVVRARHLVEGRGRVERLLL